MVADDQSPSVPRRGTMAGEDPPAHGPGILPPQLLEPIDRFGLRCRRDAVGPRTVGILVDEPRSAERLELELGPRGGAPELGAELVCPASAPFRAVQKKQQLQRAHGGDGFAEQAIDRGWWRIVHRRRRDRNGFPLACVPAARRSVRALTAAEARRPAHRERHADGSRETDRWPAGGTDHEPDAPPGV